MSLPRSAQNPSNIYYFLLLSDVGHAGVYFVDSPRNADDNRWLKYE
jgi:hypothetical protein